jgi:flagellar biogenesis protein FliO
MVCDAVEVLPQASVAVQMRVVLYDPAQSPLVVTSAKVSVNALPHSTSAVATANTGTAGQFMVVGAGRDAITGAVTSCTVMVCDAVEILPQASVAVQVRVVLYDPAQSPLVVTSAEVSVNALPHSSSAVATAKFGVSGQFIVVGAGKEAITGDVTS